MCGRERLRKEEIQTFENQSNIQRMRDTETAAWKIIIYSLTWINNK